MLPDEVGAQAVDQQDGDAAGAGQGRAEAERVGGQVAAAHGHTQRGGDAGQDVGQARAAVGGCGEVGGEPRHGRVARTCRPAAASR